MHRPIVSLPGDEAGRCRQVQQSSGFWRQPWRRRPRALDEISESLGASGATMVLGRTRRASVAVSNSVTGLIEEYFHLAIPDTRETRVLTRISDGFRTDYDDFTPAEMARDPYYQEFLAPHELGYHAAATLASGNDELVLSLKRPAHRGHYDGHELDQLQRALPHLRRAARTAAMAWRASFAGQLDSFAHRHRRRAAGPKGACG